jgi:pyruvate-ferredoxin/flavodoxin oxidoreductase
MASGSIGWLQRLWRRSGDTPAADAGTPALVNVDAAVAALEVQLCGGIAWGAERPASAAAARRLDGPATTVRNSFGRPVVEEFAAAAGDRVAVATGMALAGLRATALLASDELIAAAAALRSSAERRAPLVLHAAGAGMGHEGSLAVAESGCFQVLASSGQEALDWTLVARWAAERALVPGLVLTDATAVERLLLPTDETILAYLGRPDEPIPSPTDAQRILFGVERARALAWFDPDRPVSTGGIRSGAEADRARAAGRSYFWGPAAELLSEGMAELASRTGRPLAWVQPHRLDDAELVLVARGAGVQVARAVADQLRDTQRWKVGVLGVPWLRPFPAAEVAGALAGHRAVAVVEPLGARPPGGAPFFRELSEASGGSDGWISAICAGTGPEPAALAALCELLRRAERPAQVDLERGCAPDSGGFPRRDALLQSLANVVPELREPALPEAEAFAADPPEGRSAGLVGRDSELPPDALSELAEAVSGACGSFVRGTESRPQPGVRDVRVRAAARDFSNPGARAEVSLLLVAGDAWNALGDAPSAVARSGTLLLATAAAPEAIWPALPEAWRRRVRERELRLFAVPAAFDDALAALTACLGDGEAAALCEVPWRELAEPAAADRELPDLIRRIPRARPTHDSLPRFWGEVVQPRQGGAGDGVADPLTATGAVPAAASALQPAAEASALPRFDPAACTGCGRCWSACPDSAIGATALGIEALLGEASRIGGTQGAAADALRRAHRHLADRLGRGIAKSDAEHALLDSDSCREAWGWLREQLSLSDEDLPAYEAAFEATLAAIEHLQPVISAPLFGEPEAAKKGDGALLVLAIEPRSCLGCGLCTAVCPDDAIEFAERTPERVAEQGERWHAWEMLPDTPGEILASASAHADVGGLAGTLLSRHCGRAQIGGGDGEPGSGERLAARLVAALVEHGAQRRTVALAQRLAEGSEQLQQKVREGLAEGLSAADFDTLEEALASSGGGRGDLSNLAGRLDDLGSRAGFDRPALLRTSGLASALDARRDRLVEGADGLGRARFGVVVARGGDSPFAEWAARYPAHPYFAPLSVAPTAEGVELSRGVARGLVAEHLATVRDLRRAAAESEAPPGLPARMEAIDALRWEDLDAEERAACPPLLLLGDDRALLAEGFEALTRLLTSDLPVKVVLLDGRGALADGPEPALVAMAHRRAFVVAASPSHPQHLAENIADALAAPGPALIHLCAPSPRRHGFAADGALERARLAVESRAHVLLRYDPAGDGVFGLRASLAGNPALEDTWGEIDFATWAAGEERFAEHFTAAAEGDGPSFAEWFALPESERAGRVPVVEVDDRRLAVGERVARAAAERAAVWSALRELTGEVSPFTEKIRADLAEERAEEHRAELEALRADYEARLAAARTGADDEALERLTERLLTLSGFGGVAAPKGNGT